MPNRCLGERKIGSRGSAMLVVIATAAALVFRAQVAFAHGTLHTIPLVTPASNSVQEGFVRVINRSNRAGTVSIHAIDDSGARFGPVSLTLDAEATVHFNSTDLEGGSASKGLSGGVGDGEGNWRLELDSALDIEPLAYIRTGNGFVTSMHDLAAEESPGHYRVPFFNPGSNTDQQSRLRLINSSSHEAGVTITGIDDAGDPPPDGMVRLTLPAGEARMITAQQLESGDDDEGLTGRFGAGTGKWTLDVSSEQSIQVMSLLLSEDGNLANLSRSPYEPHRAPTSCDVGVVEEANDDDNDSLGTANSLGDLTSVANVRAREGTVNSTSNQGDYYRFTLTDTRTIRVELRNLTGNADLYVLNSLGRVAHYTHDSENEGTLDESVVATLDAGTYYIQVWAATTSTSNIGYQLRYSNDSAVPGRSLESAFDLGDLSSLAVVRTQQGEINATRNEICHFHRSYYRFTLTDTRTIRVELRNLTGNADLYVLNSLGRVAHYTHDSENEGTLDESVVATLDTGTYYIQVEAATTNTNNIGYQLRYSNDSAVPGRRLESAFDLGNLTDVAVVRTRQGQINATRNESRLFHRSYYRIILDDTRTIRVELRNLTGNADLYVLNSLGRVAHYTHDSENEGTLDESVVATLDAGTYYIQVEAATTSTRTISYELRYGPGPGP